ncbi:MAG: hypothetical protein V7719_06085 [Psychroserpens sp.]|uniref:hypothetical protein n=1 Tax=Psychroserpens sp. TaxID=2020870 RepID=UPI0030028810
MLHVLFSVYSFGQNTTTQDSTSIISYADKVIVKLDIDNQTDTYFENDNQNLLRNKNNP